MYFAIKCNVLFELNFIMTNQILQTSLNSSHLRLICSRISYFLDINVISYLSEWRTVFCFQLTSWITIRCFWNHFYVCDKSIQNKKQLSKFCGSLEKLTWFSASAYKDNHVALIYILTEKVAFETSDKLYKQDLLAWKNWFDFNWWTRSQTV